MFSIGEKAESQDKVVQEVVTHVLMGFYAVSLSKIEKEIGKVLEMGIEIKKTLLEVAKFDVENKKFKIKIEEI